MTGHMKNKQTFVVLLVLCRTVAGAEKNFGKTTVLWKFETGGLLASTTAIGADGTVYIGSLNKKVYILDGDWNLYLINYQGPGDITNALYENLRDGTFSKNRQSGAEDMGEEMAVSIAEFDDDGRGSSNFLSQFMIFLPRPYFIKDKK